MKNTAPLSSPAAELLKPIHAVNQQLVSFLVHLAQSGRAVPPGFTLAQTLQDDWRALDSAAQARAAQSSVLLIDLHFGEAEWWRQARRSGLAAIEETRRVELPVRSRLIALSRATVTLAWHMARAERDMAHLLLGMSTSVAETLAEIGPQELQLFAERQASQLRVRFGNRPMFWSELIGASRGAHTRRLRELRTYSIQLTGSGLLARPS